MQQGTLYKSRDLADKPTSPKTQDPGISPCSALLAWALPIFLYSNGPSGRGADCTQGGFSGPQLVPGLRGDRSGREFATRQCRSGHFHTQNSCSLQTLNYGSDSSESNASKQCPQLLPGKSYGCTGHSTSLGVHPNPKNKGTQQMNNSDCYKQCTKLWQSQVQNFRSESSTRWHSSYIGYRSSLQEHVVPNCTTSRPFEHLQQFPNTSPYPRKTVILGQLCIFLVAISG